MSLLIPGNICKNSVGSNVPHSSDLRFYLSDLKFRSSESLGRRESHGHLVELSHPLVDSTLAADAHQLLTLSAGTHYLLTLNLSSHLRR